MSELVESVKAARQVSTPIIAISSPDPAATTNKIRALLTKETAALAWDTAKGLRGLNDAGSATISLWGLTQDARKIYPQTLNLVETLGFIEKTPADSMVFVYNAHRFLDHIGVVQGIWNLRDVYKKNRRMLVLLGPIFKMPLELAGDVIMFDEPLPTRKQLEAVLDEQHTNAKLEKPVDQKRAHALDAIVGLPTYTAESVVAISLTKTGVDLGRLWERKIKAIENTDGLRVWRGQESMDDLKGLDQVTLFCQKLIAAASFGAIVFIDEMEKAIAGGLSEHTGDSGVSKDQVGVLLSYIQDTKSMGMLFAGLAGCGKTQLAKAMANLAGKPLIVFDLGAMKGGNVGASERTIRAALKVVTATAENKVLFIATANKTVSFTPELNRRFPDQFFFDLLDAKGRAPIWNVYGTKNGLSKDQLKIPKDFDDGWTGAEIQRVCERAAMFNCTVKEAAQFLVPSAVSARDTIMQLRQHATGKFLSASKPGWYQMPTEEVDNIHRQIDVE